LYSTVCARASVKAVFICFCEWPSVNVNRINLVQEPARLTQDRSSSSMRVSAIISNKFNHRSTNNGLGSTASAPRGGDIGDKEREVRAGRSQGSRPSGHARTKEEAR